MLVGRARIPPPPQASNHCYLQARRNISRLAGKNRFWNHCWGGGGYTMSPTKRKGNKVSTRQRRADSHANDLHALFMKSFLWVPKQLMPSAHIEPGTYFFGGGAVSLGTAPVRRRLRARARVARWPTRMVSEEATAIRYRCRSRSPVVTSVAAIGGFF